MVSLRVFSTHRTKKRAWPWARRFLLAPHRLVSTLVMMMNITPMEFMHVFIAQVHLVFRLVTSYVHASPIPKTGGVQALFCCQR
jgi:hypothetical protein